MSATTSDPWESLSPRLRELCLSRYQILGKPTVWVTDRFTGMQPGEQMRRARELADLTGETVHFVLPFGELVLRPGERTAIRYRRVERPNRKPILP